MTEQNVGEIAPPTLRGTLGTCTQFAMVIINACCDWIVGDVCKQVIGLLFSPLLSFKLATYSLWRYLFAVTPALAFFQLLVSPVLLESPRWLLSRDNNCCRARCVIKSLRGFRSKEEVENEVSNFLYASAKHKTSRDSAHSSGAMIDLFQKRNTRLLLISSIVLQMAQQLCGINAGRILFIIVRFTSHFVLLIYSVLLQCNVF